ncbi:hypothetical protein GCM10010174_70120 [Kutzneria viridogrisea]|uniref:Head-to-tail stopper n=1 Tax=Kutzneria viridogrisea TaxID=47990 RepID=A0ABR6BAT6_9PSEU|nr:hypothetical protein [Kutzneria viridogrisea]
MADIPAWLLRHTATIEPYEGTGAAGPIYGAPVTVRCFVDDVSRLVRSGDGTEAVSSATLYCPLDTVAPAESRVTVNGHRPATVFTTFRRDGGGLPTPDHLEVVLQ